MAKSQIPNPMARRHLIEREMTAERSRAVADAYLAEGRASEALAFVAKAEDWALAGELADRAVAEGDAFLLTQLAAILPEPPDAARWLELADVAEGLGKARYAEMARRAARSSEG